MKPLICLLFLLAPTLALAQEQASSIADCEKIKADLAYNNCLASFGPKIGERRSRAAAAPADVDEEPAAQRGSRSGSYSRRGRRGRISASFNVRGGEVRQSRTRASRAYRSRGSGSRSYRRRR
jgi:hypothetical protein